MENDPKTEAEQLFEEHGDKAVFIAGERGNDAALRNDVPDFKLWAAVVSHLKDMVGRG